MASSSGRRGSRSTTSPQKGDRSEGALRAKKTSPAAELLPVRSFVQTPSTMNIAQSPKTERVHPATKTRAFRMRSSRRILVLGESRDGDRALDAHVAGDRLREDLDERGVGIDFLRRRIPELELGARVAADRVRVDVEARAAPDPDRDVAGDRLQVDPSLLDSLEVLVAGDGVGRDGCARVADLEVAGDELGVDIALEDVGVDVTRGGLRVQISVDVTQSDVPTRRLDLCLLRLVDLHVARCRLGLDGAVVR